MTTRYPLLGSPLLLGFEPTWALVERAARAAEGYPPYNVEQLDERRIRITLAVAGFTRAQLQVGLDGRQLLVSGRREDEAGDGPGAYLHRGIAARGFQRVFVLADGMRVEDAMLAHGLLHIDLARPDETSRLVEIPIRAAG